MATINIDSLAGVDDNARLTAAYAAVSGTDTIQFSGGTYEFENLQRTWNKNNVTWQGVDGTKFRISNPSGSGAGDRVSWYIDSNSTTFNNIEFEFVNNSTGNMALWPIYRQPTHTGITFTDCAFTDSRTWTYTPGATPNTDGTWNSTWSHQNGAAQRGRYVSTLLNMGAAESSDINVNLTLTGCTMHHLFNGITVPRGVGGTTVQQCTFIGHWGEQGSTSSGADGNSIWMEGHNFTVGGATQTLGNTFRDNDVANGSMLNRAINMQGRGASGASTADPATVRNNTIEQCGSRANFTYIEADETTGGGTSGTILEAEQTQVNVGEAILMHTASPDWATHGGGVAGANDARLCIVDSVTLPSSDTESLTLAKTHNPLMIVDGSTARTRAGFITNAAQGTYEEEVAADDPLGWWKMDETSGTSFANSATKSGGVAEALTLVGTPTLNDSMTTAGITYKGVDFTRSWPLPDGGEQFAYVEQSSGWLPTAYPFCFEFVMKVESNSQGVGILFALGNQQDSAVERGSLQIKQAYAVWYALATNISGTGYNFGNTQATEYADGDVAHCFYRCVSASEMYGYVDGRQRFRVIATPVDVFESYPFDSLCVNGIWNDSGTGNPTGNGSIGQVALYNTDVSPARIACHAAACKKHYDLKLEGTAASVTAISNHGGASFESDGTAANLGDIGQPDTPANDVNFFASIFDDMGERRWYYNHEEHGICETAYTIVAAVSRDGYSDADMIICNNAGASTGGWFGASRTVNDGISLEIEADDTAKFKHQGTTVNSTSTITTDATTVITARFDTGTMSIFVNGSDKQDQAGAASNLMSSGMTSIGVDAAQTGSGFDGRIGPIMVFPSALSDAEILALSTAILSGSGGGGGGGPTINIRDEEGGANPTAVAINDRLFLICQNSTEVGEYQPVTTAANLNSAGDVVVDANFDTDITGDEVLLIGLNKNVTISDNRITGIKATEAEQTGFKTAGIYVWKDGMNVTVENNQIDRCHQGILVSQSSKHYLHTVTVQNNTVQDVIENFDPGSWWTYRADTRGHMALGHMLTHNGEGQGGNSDAPNESIGRVTATDITFSNNTIEDGARTYYQKWRWPDRVDDASNNFGDAVGYCQNFSLTSGNDVSIRTIRMLAPTTTGQQVFDVPEMNAPVKAAWFICNYADTDDTSEDGAMMGFGATDGTRNWSCAVSSEDNQGATDGRRRGDDAHCVMLLNFDGTVDGEASVVSLGANSATINWTDAPAAIRYVTCVLFGGDNVSAYAARCAGNLASPAQISEINFGFCPDMIMVGSAGDYPMADSIEAQATITMGVAVNDGSETQHSISWTDQPSADPTAVMSELSTTHIVRQNWGNAYNAALQLDSFDADGVTWTTAGGWVNDKVGFLGLNFDGSAQVDLSQVNAPALAGVDSQTGPGFKPSFLMSFNTMPLSAAINTIATDSTAEYFGVGVSDGLRSYSNQIRSVDDVLTTNTTSKSSEDQAISLGGNVATAAFTDSGYDLTYSASASQMAMSHLTIGPVINPQGVAVKCVRAAAPTSVTTQEFTASGIGRPKAAMFFVTKGLSENTSANDSVMGIGATDGTNQCVASVTSQDGQGTTVCDRQATTTQCILVLSNGGASVDGEASISSWIKDGVRISWGNAPAGAYLITCVLYGGDALTAGVGVADPNIVDAAQSITGLGSVDALVAFQGGHDFDDAAAAHGKMCVGFAANDGNVSQRCLSYQNVDAAGTSAMISTVRGSRLVYELADGGSTEASSVILNSFDADGFTFTPKTSIGLGTDFGYLALAFSDKTVARVGKEQGCADALGSTGCRWPVMKPTFVMQYHAGDCNDDQTKTDASASSMAVSVFDGDSQFVNGVCGEDNAGTSDCVSISSAAGVALPAASGMSAIGTYSRMVTTGFEINITSILANLNYGGLAIGQDTEEGEGYHGKFSKGKMRTRFGSGVVSCRCLISITDI